MLNIYSQNSLANDLTVESVNRFETVTLHNWVVATKQKPLYRARVCLKSLYYIVYINHLYYNLR